MKPALHPIEQYGKDVLAGKHVAGDLQKRAIQRHFDDLKTGKKRGLRFDQEAAEHFLDIWQYLRHWQGEWGGEIINLGMWQKLMFWILFGWLRTDNTRRFRTAYITMARKNSKSTMAAGVGTYLLTADDEPGAQIYSAATKRKQARIIFDIARHMALQSPQLKRLIEILRHNLNVQGTGSMFEPLGADADTTDGLNVHGALIDELHAHKTRDMYDILQTATGARRQPLVFITTTAGTDRESICREVHDKAEEILTGAINDDSFFAWICTIDEDDDWRDESCWVKANPNIGISPKWDDLREKCENAKHIPRAQNTFKRLQLNVWTQQVDRWIDLEMWNAQAGDPINEEDLLGRPCYGGLDLASVSDLTAWVMVFPNEETEIIDVLCRFWCPEARLHDTTNRYQSSYQEWEQEGSLRVTPGNAIDAAWIKRQIFEDAEKFNIVDLNVDRLFQGYQLSMELAEELGEERVIGMGQGFISMAAPMKEFERRILKCEIHHGGNPVLRWMANNVAVKEDPAGNFKPDKATSQGKIDGIVALVMALDRLSRHDSTDGESVYNDIAPELLEA